MYFSEVAERFLFFSLFFFLLYKYWHNVLVKSRNFVLLRKVVTVLKAVLKASGHRFDNHMLDEKTNILCRSGPSPACFIEINTLSIFPLPRLLTCLFIFHLLIHASI